MRIRTRVRQQCERLVNMVRTPMPCPGSRWPNIPLRVFDFGVLPLREAMLSTPGSPLFNLGLSSRRSLTFCPDRAQQMFVLANPKHIVPGLKPWPPRTRRTQSPPPRRVGYFFSSHWKTNQLDGPKFACRKCGFVLASSSNRRAHERVYHRIMAAQSRALDRRHPNVVWD